MGVTIPKILKGQKMQSAIGNRLKKFRKAKGLSVKEVARHVGVAESTYRDWEYGRMIKGEPYLKIAEVLGVSLSSLFDDSIDDVNVHVAKHLDVIQQAVHAIRVRL